MQTRLRPLILRRSSISQLLTLVDLHASCMMELRHTEVMLACRSQNEWRLITKRQSVDRAIKILACRHVSNSFITQSCCPDGVTRSYAVQPFLQGGSTHSCGQHGSRPRPGPCDCGTACTRWQCSGWSRGSRLPKRIGFEHRAQPFAHARPLLRRGSRRVAKRTADAGTCSDCSAPCSQCWAACLVLWNLSHSPEPSGLQTPRRLL